MYSPYQEAVQSALGYNPFQTTAGGGTSLLEQLLRQEAANNAAPAAPAAPTAGGATPTLAPEEQARLAALAESGYLPDSSGRAEAPYGGPGPGGRPSTGNFAQDVRGAYQSGLFNAGLGLAANPASLAVNVPATMLGAAIRGVAGIPNPTTFQAGWGLRGLLSAPYEAVFGISPVERATREAVPTLETLQALEAQGMDLGYGGLSPEGALAAAAISDAIGRGIGPESMGYGGPTSESKDFGSDGFGDSQSENTSGGEDGGAKGDESSNWRAGGLVKYASGGLIELAEGGKIAVGLGGGLDDLIPTSIDGRRAAALSDGEFVVPADVVSMMGDGSSNAGARRLYDMVRSIRQNKTGTARQAGPLPVGKILERTMS